MGQCAVCAPLVHLYHQLLLLVQLYCQILFRYNCAIPNSVIVYGLIVMFFHTVIMLLNVFITHNNYNMRKPVL